MHTSACRETSDRRLLVAASTAVSRGWLVKYVSKVHGIKEKGDGGEGIATFVM
jgi:hypothetical protein